MAARAGVEPTTLRLKAIDSTKAPPCPTIGVICTPTTNPLFVSGLGTGIGATFSSYVKVSGCECMKQRFRSKSFVPCFSSGQGLSHGPGSLMAANVTTRLPHTHSIHLYINNIFL